MVKTKVRLDTRKRTKSGEYPLVIVLTRGSTSAHIPTGIRLRPEQWNEKKQEGAQIVKHEQASLYNRIYKNKHAKVVLAITELASEKKLSNLTASEIKKELQNKEAGADCAVSYYYPTFVDRKEKKSTRESFNYTYSKLSEFADMDGLKFSSITVTFLLDFNKWMSKTCGVNTRAVHLENLRAVYNGAIKEKLVDGSFYPFNDFKIEREEAEKRALSITDLIKIRDCKCEKHLEEYRDMFMLSFYLAGINLLDMFLLPPQENLDTITYRRSKTKVLWSYRIPQEAKDIIEKYRGKDHLLQFADRYVNHKDYLSRMDKNLKKIGEFKILKGHGKVVRNPIAPKLTFYAARHTWATVASEADINDATIDRALAHKGRFPMTDVYVVRNKKKVEKALRDVIAEVEKRKALSSVLYSLVNRANTP